MSTSGPAHRVQSAVEDYGYPRGHLGHLTTDEEAALTNFKLVIADKGLYKPGATEADPGTHDDATLLRFLRARRFVVADALVQFSDTEVWRKANELDVLYETIDVEEYDETRRLYPQWTGRRDKRGIPIYLYEVKHLNSKMMANYEKNAAATHHKAKTDGKTAPKLLRLFALYENLTQFVMPLATQMTDREYPTTPITQSNNIVDISGVGLKQFWNLRTHMQDASTLATAHYPETLDRIFVIGAPVFFPTVWGWIKRWFDPITTSKIFILGHHETRSVLRQFIDSKNIPKKYGGELDYEFGHMPSLDPELKHLITWQNGYTDFPHGPLHWIDKGKYVELRSAGSVDQKERNDVICMLKKTVHDNEVTTKSTGAPVVAATPLRPELIQNPTEKEHVPQIVKQTLLAASNGDAEVATSSQISDSKPEGSAAETANVIVQEGEVVPTSRPEPQTFHSAKEEITTATISEKADTPIMNGTAGPKPVVPA